MNWLFAAGGTGGHIYPAIALADYISEHRVQDEIYFITTEKQMDQKIISQAGYAFECFAASGFNRSGFLKKIKALISGFKIFFHSLRFIQQKNIDVVYGVGGYLSAPVLLAAFLRRKKIAILEPNVIAGMSNRWMAKISDFVFVAFEESQHFFSKDKCIFSGNPIRKNIMQVAAPTFKEKKICLMIFGGSQGAKQINDLICACLPNLAAYKDKVKFVHQTGVVSYQETCEAYQKYDFEYEVHQYIEDMHLAYAAADIVLARSGSSVLELAACGLPSILIPYPYAADNHQRANAKVIQGKDAAYVLTGKNISEFELREHLKILLNEPKRRIKMRDQALTLRREDTLETIISTLVAAVQRDA